MFARQELKDLAVRKRMLLTEAELHRRLIQTDLGALRASSERGASNPFVIGGLSLASLGAIGWLCRKGRWKTAMKSAPILLNALRLFRR